MNIRPVEYITKEIASYLNEDNLVMFLWRSYRDWFTGRDVFGLWWWHMYVHMFVDDRCLSRCTVYRCRCWCPVTRGWWTVAAEWSFRHR